MRNKIISDSKCRATKSPKFSGLARNIIFSSEAQKYFSQSALYQRHAWFSNFEPIFCWNYRKKMEFFFYTNWQGDERFCIYFKKMVALICTTKPSSFDPESVWRGFKSWYFLFMQLLSGKQCYLYIIKVNLTFRNHFSVVLYANKRFPCYKMCIILLVYNNTSVVFACKF